MPDAAARQTSLELALAEMCIAHAHKISSQAAVLAAAGPRWDWREPLLPPTAGGVREVDPDHPALGAFRGHLVVAEVPQWSPSAGLLAPTTAAAVDMMAHTLAELSPGGSLGQNGSTTSERHMRTAEGSSLLRYAQLCGNLPAACWAVDGVLPPVWAQVLQDNVPPAAGGAIPLKRQQAAVRLAQLLNAMQLMRGRSYTSKPLLNTAWANLYDALSRLPLHAHNAGKARHWG